MCDDNSEQFSLRWNNFFSNLTSGFHSLWQEEDFVDVTLAADGKFVQAHKIVLSVCSPYFMRLFKVNPCKHPIVILKDVGYKELDGLLHFMYRGEVNVYQEELANFLKTAELLQIKGLTSNESQASANEESAKEDKTSSSTPEDKKKSSSCHNQTITIPGKRKRPDLDQASSNSPSRIAEQTSTVLSIPPLPKLEPIDFVESESPGSTNANDSLASFFEGESSRHVTNKPGQRLIANFSQDPLDAAQATFRVTSRGRLQLVQNNYVYHCNRQKDNKIFWKCAEYNRTGCRGRCISIGWAVTVTHALHNHYPILSDSMLDDTKIISDLSEMKHVFMSPRQVNLEHNQSTCQDKVKSLFQGTLTKQPNDVNPINLEGF